MPALPARWRPKKFSRAWLNRSAPGWRGELLPPPQGKTPLAPSASGVKPLNPLLSLILAALMILLIDNYDSFTFNLAHQIGGLGEDVKVERNDALSVEEALSPQYEAIVLSPGPCTPNEAGICVDLIKGAAETGKPVFGVCLGMQSIAQAFGGRIVRAGKLMHGKTCGVLHDGTGIFAGAPSPMTATRYHSLVAEKASLPEELLVTASADDDGEIMAVFHKTLPIGGVQFHPESIATEAGTTLIENFLKMARAQ